jgi:hypothetical protein
MNFLNEYFRFAFHTHSDEVGMEKLEPLVRSGTLSQSGYTGISRSAFSELPRKR